MTSDIPQCSGGHNNNIGWESYNYTYLQINEENVDSIHIGPLDMAIFIICQIVEAVNYNLWPVIWVVDLKREFD